MGTDRHWQQINERPFPLFHIHKKPEQNTQTPNMLQSTVNFHGKAQMSLKTWWAAFFSERMAEDIKDVKIVSLDSIISRRRNLLRRLPFSLAKNLKSIRMRFEAEFILGSITMWSNMAHAL